MIHVRRTQRDERGKKQSQEQVVGSARVAPASAHGKFTHERGSGWVSLPRSARGWFQEFFTTRSRVWNRYCRQYSITEEVPRRGQEYEIYSSR